MSYQDDLNSPQWKSKRKQIIIRDNLRCINCSNENLIKNCLVGLLIEDGGNEKGILFHYNGYDSLEIRVRKKVFVKKENVMLPFGPNRFNLIYIDPEFENELFQRVAGIRELQQIDDKLSINDFNNVFKISSDSFSKISEGFELPLNLHAERFKESADKLKNIIKENFNWKYVPALHVHHTYYQTNLKPWEYPNESLQTLCWVCHEELHKNQTIPVFDEIGRQLDPFKPCSKCHGAGWFPEFKHVEQGICFD